MSTPVLPARGKTGVSIKRTEGPDPGVEAIRAKAETLIHVSNLYHIEPQIHLGKLLCEQSFADRAFFCNSGAEANEAAVKLAARQVSSRDGMALKSPDELRQLYSALDPDKETVVYCQSGVRASETAVVLRDLGFIFDRYGFERED